MSIEKIDAVDAIVQERLAVIREHVADMPGGIQIGNAYVSDGEGSVPHGDIKITVPDDLARARTPRVTLGNGETDTEAAAVLIVSDMLRDPVFHDGALDVDPESVWEETFEFVGPGQWDHRLWARFTVPQLEE